MQYLKRLLSAPILVFMMAAGLTATPMAQAQADGASGPRPGKYTILSYGATNRPPLVLGSFVLGKGSYEAFLVGGRSTGSGKYSYDASAHTVQWVSGPYAGVWGGAFTVDGKTHKIRMKSTTIGTNTAN